MGGIHTNSSNFFNACLRIDMVRERNVFFAGFALILVFCLPAMAGTITVCSSGCNYTTIQEAINNAQPCDTIEVMSGTYDPTLLVNKSVSIIGVDTGSGIPIIGDDGITIAAVTISAENVTLDNVCIIGSVRTAVEIEANYTTLRRIRAESIDQEDQARIPVIHAADNLTQITVSDSVIRTNGGTGIYIEDGSDITITNNTVAVNRSAPFTREAIWAEYAQDKVIFSDITIADNTVEGGMIDVGALSRFENMPHPIIENILVHNNTVTHCSPSGIQIIGNVHVTTDQEYIYDLINVTVTDNEVLDYEIRSGIEVSWANGGIISGNAIEDGFGGIAGLRLAQAANFTVTDNTVTSCTGGQQIVGFDLREVKESNVRGNTMTENQMNFAYTAGGELRPNMTIDTTNTADGRPIYYYESKNNFTVNAAQDPACLILVDCGNVMVENITPSKNDAGLVVYNSHDVVVQSSNIHDCYNGIMLAMSSNCDIRNNTIDTCSMGAVIFDLHDSSISNNLFTGNGGAINHYQSAENTLIANNTIKDNEYGIWTYFVEDGSSISYSGNTLEVGDNGICVISSDLLSFTNNVIRNFNNCAIQARISQSNQFRDNIIENTEDGGEECLAIYLVNAANINNQTIYRGGNHTLVNNYINTSAHVSIENEIPGEPIDVIMPRWLESLSLPELPAEDDILPDIWNLTKTSGRNIVSGPYLGGNYWAHPNGTGWSQVHPDRGDGFCDASYVFDDMNIDYLPLHLYTPEPDPEQKYNFKSISSGEQIATDIGEGVSKNKVTIITRQS